MHWDNDISQAVGQDGWGEGPRKDEKEKMKRKMTWVVRSRLLTEQSDRPHLQWQKIRRTYLCDRACIRPRRLPLPTSIFSLSGISRRVYFEIAPQAFSDEHLISRVSNFETRLEEPSRVIPDGSGPTSHRASKGLQKMAQPENHVAKAENADAELETIYVHSLRCALFAGEKVIRR